MNSWLFFLFTQLYRLNRKVSEYIKIYDEVNKMKKRSLLLICLVLSVSILLSACSSENGSEGETLTLSEGETLTLSIGTASMGGAYYPIGQEIANLVTKHTENIKMTPEVTGGAVENPRLVDSGEVDLGITNANLAYFAYNGTEPYDAKLDISAIASLHPSVFHIIVKDNAKIESIKDFKGKKIAVGPAGGGTLPILEILLESEGLSIDDVVPSYLSYADGFSQLSDGNVDIALALSGYPASSVLELTATTKIRFISVDDDKLENILSNHPYYSKIIVPKDTYKLEEDAIAIGVRNILIVRNDMSEDVVYEITKAIFDNLDEFQEANANAKQIDLESAQDVPIPLHPGAQRYFDGLK